ncbi:hypothetical protein RMSM_05641 [Rhodopirellula maiorica SM1]|uniref:Uncharacterized protein n=1 Tax=Rhodopirellula maiorica SM1 TaxID=1265738 RepID=M5RPV1_9BACT|nr:hypothetical protein RMSM_05641 [Rhodopirellula maiorica SM1]
MTIDKDGIVTLKRGLSSTRENATHEDVTKESDRLRWCSDVDCVKILLSDV